ncbi:MAG: phage adaptor protein [Methylobacter sp.]
MAFATYSDLQAGIANWLHRSDLTSQIPDFITLAESRINRNLRAIVPQTEQTLTATIGSRLIPIPAGMVEIESLWLTYYQPRRKLVYKQPTELVLNISPGMPNYWTIDGSNIALDGAADNLYTFTLRTFQIFALSNAAPTNWLLTNHPDLYLYASLLEAAPFIRDNDQITVWKAAYDIAMAEIQDKESRAGSLATLQMDMGIRKNSTTGAIFSG